MMALVIVYLLIFGLALAASFLVRKKPARTIAIVTSCAMVVPLLLGGLLYLSAQAFFGSEPPTLQEIQRKFPKHRKDLETMVQMSNQDSEFARIAPDFDFKFSVGHPDSNPSADPEDLQQQRWDEYRRIFRHNDIRLGILRDREADVFIMIDSIGLLNRSHATGYLYCAENPSPDADRFEACTSNQTSGARRFDPNTKAEAYSFIKLADHWYAFDQGPS